MSTESAINFGIVEGVCTAFQIVLKHNPALLLCIMAAVTELPYDDSVLTGILECLVRNIKDPPRQVCGYPQEL